MVCSKCGQRPALVFITEFDGKQTRQKGLCMFCARELKIPTVTEYIDKLGLTEDDMNELNESVMELFRGEDNSPAPELPNDFLKSGENVNLADDIEHDGNGVDGFENGGANIMPDFFKKLLQPFKMDETNFTDKNKQEHESNRFEDSSFNETFFETPPEKRYSEKFSNSFDHRFDSKEDRKEKRTRVKPKEKEKQLRYVDAYCTNLSKKAAEGKIDRIIGRDKEIARVIQILSRRTKNNPCLIGEPGVGKTAIAEGIAQHIAEGDVPYNIAEKRVYLLDMTALVAGTQFRGQFEARVKNLIAEVKQEGNIILFIDEVHTLVGAGDAEGSMNAANIFKPALSRGEVQVIGATTFTEYRKYIEKDSALERRFQPVAIKEPTIEDSIEILRGIKSYYEEFHSVRISDYLLKQCAVLSERYITDRFLPDKAIDLLDESCACANIRHPEIGRYKTLSKRVKVAQNLEESIYSENEPDYQVLAQVKSDIISMKKELDELGYGVNDIKVEEKDISKVVELWTGIPAAKIEEAEFTKIGKLEETLKTHIVGQDEAIHLLTNAIKRNRVQLSKRRRPASFIFVGPTGVGKTELVKVLSNELFDATEPLIRLDMSEFMEKHAVSRIVGSPPGYVGYDEAGQLTEKVRRKPYSVVLFDEIEKAHPDVMNILLQILDEGKINDAQGRTVSFENTVIAMTSNAGSTDKSVGMGFAKSEYEVSKERALKALREFLRPEFLGRVDEVVVFKPLTKNDYAQVAALMLDEMREPLGEKSVTLSYDDNALRLIAEKAFNKKMGARDIRRVIRSEIEDKIADEIIEKSGYMSSIDITALANELFVSSK